MLISLTTLLTNLSSIFHSRAALQMENLALRHQIGVLQRSIRNCPKLTLVDRLLWVWLSRIWSGWRSALAIVRPETVVANPSWGAPRIHGELLKLGIDIGESSVSKYMVRNRKPPSQTWRTFLENHAQQLVFIDFFTVP